MHLYIKFFKMELTSIIIGATLFVAILIPFIWMIMKNKKKEKQLVNELIEYAKTSNSNNCEIDNCAEIAIGYDKITNCAFFIKRKENLFYKQKVNLLEVQSCEVKKEISKTAVLGSKETRIEKLELKFNFKNNSSEVVEFFNIQGSIGMDGELKMIEKWCDTFKSEIGQLKKVILKSNN